MNRNIIAATVTAVLIAVANPMAASAGEMLSREATRDVITGAVQSIDRNVEVPARSVLVLELSEPGAP